MKPKVYLTQVTTVPGNQVLRRPRGLSGAQGHREWMKEDLLGQEQGGQKAGLSHLQRKGTGGSREGKGNEESNTETFQQELHLRPGVQVKTYILGHEMRWEILGGWAGPEGCLQLLESDLNGVRANASRGAAQSETATIRVKLNSFESFFPSDSSQPSRTDPSREPERERGKEGAPPGLRKKLPSSLDSKSARMESKLQS